MSVSQEVIDRLIKDAKYNGDELDITTLLANKVLELESLVKDEKKTLDERNKFAALVREEILSDRWAWDIAPDDEFFKYCDKIGLTNKQSADDTDKYAYEVAGILMRILGQDENQRTQQILGFLLSAVICKPVFATEDKLNDN